MSTTFLGQKPLLTACDIVAVLNTRVQELEEGKPTYVHKSVVELAWSQDTMLQAQGYIRIAMQELFTGLLNEYCIHMTEPDGVISVRKVGDYRVDTRQLTQTFPFPPVPYNKRPVAKYTVLDLGSL